MLLGIVCVTNYTSLSAQGASDKSLSLPKPIPVQRLAIHPLSFTNLSDRDGAILDSRIRTIIKKNGNYYLFSGDQVREILRSQSLSTQNNCKTVDCLSTFGSNTGADFSIGGEIILFSNGYHFDLNLVGVMHKKRMNYVSKLLSNDWEQLINFELPALINRLLETPEFETLGTLIVKSDADSATVYLDGILVGKTPYTKYDLSFGYHSVRVINTSEFKEKTEKFYITPEEPKLTVIANFRFKLGELYVSGLPYGADLTLNDLEVGVIPYKDEKVFWGDYNITAKHIGYHDQELKTVIDSYDPKHVELVLKYKNRYLAVFYSAILPGWGQAYSGHYKRASVFPIIYGAGVFASIFMNRQYSTALTTYEEKRDIYKASLLLEERIEGARTDMDSALSNAKSKRLIGLSAVTATAIFWYYNINDALREFPPRIRDPWDSEKARFQALSYSVTEKTLLISLNTNF